MMGETRLISLALTAEDVADGLGVKETDTVVLLLRHGRVIAEFSKSRVEHIEAEEIEGRPGSDTRQRLSGIIRGRRTAIPLTLVQLAALSSVSQSQLSRIETGNRFPSAAILCRIAKPLGFAECELLALAGYMSPGPSMLKQQPEENGVRRVDLHVAKVLAQEPVEVQRALVGMLPILKRMAKQVTDRELLGKENFPRTLGVRIL